MGRTKIAYDMADPLDVVNLITIRLCSPFLRLPAVKILESVFFLFVISRISVRLIEEIAWIFAFRPFVSPKRLSEPFVRK